MGTQFIAKAVAASIIIAFGGCHVHTYSTGVPLYDRSEAVIDPTLMGVWSNDDMRLTIDVAPPYGMSTQWDWINVEELATTVDTSAGFMPTDFVHIGEYTYLFPYESPDDYWRAEYGIMYRVDRQDDALILSVLDGTVVQLLLQENAAFSQATCETRPIRDASTGEAFPAFTHTRVSLPVADFRSLLLGDEHDEDLFVPMQPLRRER